MPQKHRGKLEIFLMVLLVLGMLLVLAVFKPFVYRRQPSPPVQALRHRFAATAKTLTAVTPSRPSGSGASTPDRSSASLSNTSGSVTTSKQSSRHYLPHTIPQRRTTKSTPRIPLPKLNPVKKPVKTLVQELVRHSSIITYLGQLVSH